MHLHDENVQHRRLVWRMSFIDHGQPAWGFAQLDGATLVEVLEKMSNFESMTVAEIFAGGNPRGVKYPVDDAMPPQIKDRLEDLGLDDLTQIVRLRLTGPQRLFGILREHVFFLLWWDPRHEIWPSSRG